jgi:ABC-type transport system involved in multi-copper enzyme maturation permease subunit
MKIIALILGTSRELAAKATLYVLAGISTLLLLGVALSVSSATHDGKSALVIFGNEVTPPAGDDAFPKLVSQMESSLANGLFVGVVLFGMFATAGVLPDALDKGTVDLYLSKPIARWELVLGKFLGAVTAIGANILYFIGVLWVIVGLKVGVWDFGFLISIPAMTFVFACLFAVVAFFGVLSRNMGIAIIAGFVYLLVIAQLLEGRETGLYMLSSGSVYRAIIDGLYYALPQIPSMQGNLLRSISGTGFDWRPFGQSFLSSAAFLGLAAWNLQKRDF